MPARPLPFLFIACVLLLVPRAYGQEVDTIAAEAPVRLVLTDGSTLIGTVERETDEGLVFRTTDGVRVEVPKDRIRRREALSGHIVDGQYRRSDPNRTRLLFAPTARPLQSGQGYFASYELFFPFAAVGVGRVASLAGGFSLIPGVGSQLVYFAPKLTLYDTPGTSLAAGTLVGTALGEESAGGLLYGLGTFGAPDAALTAGAGFAFGGGEVFTEVPILLLGGEYRLSNSIKLLSENYIFAAEGGTVLLSAGVRFFGDQLAADLGFFTAPELLDEGGSFPFLPWVGFAYNFDW